MKRKELTLPNSPLMRGDSGLDVIRLQECLDNILKLKGKKKLQSIEPNHFGLATEAAVKAFQIQQFTIRTSGIYDKMTRAKLREAIGQCR